MEAWRLLDPDYSIFKRDELLMKRMLCVPHPQKKDLLNVLRQVCTADSCFSVHCACCPSDGVADGRGVDAAAGGQMFLPDYFACIVMCCMWACLCSRVGQHLQQWSFRTASSIPNIS